MPHRATARTATRPAAGLGLALGAALLAVMVGGAALAATPPDWHDQKCARYRTAWASAVARLGTGGLSRDFLDRHAAFLASNCTRRSDVCPRSAEELRLANLMVVVTMNFGAASTFVPFFCR